MHEAVGCESNRDGDFEATGTESRAGAVIRIRAEVEKLLSHLNGIPRPGGAVESARSAVESGAAAWAAADAVGCIPSQARAVETGSVAVECGAY